MFGFGKNKVVQLGLFPDDDIDIQNVEQVGNFLKAAKEVLKRIGKPMRANDITIEAIKGGFLTTSGKTPGHTMRARLSENLRKMGMSSVFQRVGSNRFALREWKMKEFIAPQFSKIIPSENVVCFDIRNDLFFQTISNGIFNFSNEFAQALKARAGVSVQSRKQAESRIDLKQLVSYVVLQDENHYVLTYMRGKYSAAHQTLLKGKYSLGFGGHVLDNDLYDLFSKDDCGVRMAAMREVNEELKGLRLNNIELKNIIFDTTSTEGLKHFAIVSKSILPSEIDFSSIKRELSINGIKLQSPQELWENFHLFEYWSQLVISSYFSKYKPSTLSNIFPGKRPKNANTIILVGEIASGKTSILEGLLKSDKFNYISARQCLIEILKIPDFKNNSRAEFQRHAQKLIESPRGAKILADKLYSKVKDGKISLIDGVRNLSTIRELRQLMGDCIIVYTECPRNKALNNFKKRVGETFSINEFINSREHKTERELPLLISEADAILFNAGSLEETLKIFRKWLK